MPETPGKMHMYDMVKIDTIVFEIVGGGGLLKPPPPGSLAVWNSPDRIGLNSCRYKCTIDKILWYDHSIIHNTETTIYGACHWVSLVQIRFFVHSSWYKENISFAAILVNNLFKLMNFTYIIIL